LSSEYTLDKETEELSLSSGGGVKNRTLNHALEFYL
jgi:hypothetical protein